MSKQLPQNITCDISIILPFYNAEKTIQTTLNSLISQTKKNIEILCIDDGSTDNSVKLVEQLIGQSEIPVRLFKQQNQGVFKAREVGINNAKGTYVGFCDADDTVNLSMFEKLYNSAKQNNADMAICAFHRFSDRHSQPSNEMTSFGNSILDVSYHSGWLTTINTALWNKIIRTTIAKKHIKLSKQPRITEDALFLLSIYPHLKTISFLNEPLYSYQANFGNAMRSISSNDYKTIFSCWIEARQEISNSNSLYIDILDLAAFIHLGLSLPLIMIKNNDSELLRSYLKECREILDYYFPHYLNNEFLKLKYIHNNPSTMKMPYFASLAWKLNLLKPALKSYKQIDFISKSKGRW